MLFETWVATCSVNQDLGRAQNSLGPTVLTSYCFKTMNFLAVYHQ